MGASRSTEAERWPIHRAAPALAAQRRGVEFLETGIKVIDLLAPLPRGGKAGLIGGAGVGKTVLLQEFIRSVNHDHAGNLRLCRSGRAHPRGERPLARDAGDGRPGECHPPLRPDERPAGKSVPGRARGPDHGRVLPRRAQHRSDVPGRQYLPLCPGGFRSLGALGKASFRGRLSAHAGR